jgi:hypothetical protein
VFFPWGRSKEIPPPGWVNRVAPVVIVVAIIFTTCAFLRLFVLWVERPGLMPQSLMTPGLRQELQKQGRFPRP